MTSQSLSQPEKIYAKGLAKKERNRRYKQANKEKIIAQNAEYRQANKEKITAYYQANREKLLAQVKEYHHTREGLVAHIYGNQRYNSKQRGHPEPDYSLEDLRAWVFNQLNFEALYRSWVDSDFDKTCVPSCDRLDDYQPYTLDNLQIVTWVENHARYGEDAKHGINNKNSKAVLQLTKTGVLIAEHCSASHASRITGVNLGNLSECCKSKRKTAGGYMWQFA